MSSVLRIGEMPQVHRFLLIFRAKRDVGDTYSQFFGRDVNPIPTEVGAENAFYLSRRVSTVFLGRCYNDHSPEIVL